MNLSLHIPLPLPLQFSLLTSWYTYIIDQLIFFCCVCFQFHNTTYGGAVKGWIRKPFSFLGSCVPGIMNPHAKAVQRWNKFFVISCLVSIFIDPLFFFLLSVQEVPFFLYVQFFDGT